MFHGALIDLLRSDTALAATVTSYAGAPAVFADEAPEDAVKPYLVVRISHSYTVNDPVAQSDVYVDYYDYGVSRVKAETAAERIEALLDLKILQSTRHGDIRMSIMSAGMIEGTDPRDVHHNTLVSARSIRRKWINTTR